MIRAGEESGKTAQGGCVCVVVVGGKYPTVCESRVNWESSVGTVGRNGIEWGRPAGNRIQN